MFRCVRPDKQDCRLFTATAANLPIARIDKSKWKIEIYREKTGNSGSRRGQQRKNKKAAQKFNNAESGADVLTRRTVVANHGRLLYYIGDPRRGRHKIDYFKRMSFLTLFTPETPRATSVALLMPACELTKPLNCTEPLNVSTLISVALVIGSLTKAAFTLAVMAESSIYYAVPAVLAVDAQPTIEIMNIAKKRVTIFFATDMVSSWRWLKFF